MKDLGLQDIPVAQIDVSDRLRAIDDGYVALLAENIAQTERLRQPLEVRKVKDGFRLIAGGHRHAAVQRLGWFSVPCFVFEASAEEARLAEIDENLVRHELNPLDRAVFLAERKSLYEALHPEAKKGGNRGNQHTGGRQTEIVSFSRDTAERCGLTDRTIRTAVMIATRLDPQVRATIAGTWISRNQSELLQLVKSESAAEQRAIVAELLADTPKAKRVAEARRLVANAPVPAEKHPDDKAFEALYSQWGRASAAAKRAFLARLQADGDLSKFLTTREMETA